MDPRPVEIVADAHSTCFPALPVLLLRLSLCGLEPNYVISDRARFDHTKNCQMILSRRASYSLGPGLSDVHDIPIRRTESPQ